MQFRKWLITESNCGNEKQSLTKILSAASRLDPGIFSPYFIRHADDTEESGFIGTVDYASPEQIGPTKDRSLDIYEKILLHDLPRLLPELTDAGKKTAVLWRAFRRELVMWRDEHGLKNNVIHRFKPVEDPEHIAAAESVRPIVYAVVVHSLADATKTFAAIDQCIGHLMSFGDKYNRLNRSFRALISSHNGIRLKAARRLSDELQRLRNDPENYD
jgi:serine/threonine protein kinase